MKDWEVIADNLSKAGWSWGCVSALDANGRTIWIADAHRGDGKRFIVRADEKLTAFLELESAVRASQRLITTRAHQRVTGLPLPLWYSRHSRREPTRAEPGPVAR